MAELPILGFESADHWWAWLEENHASSSGLWLKIAKKDSGHASVSYQEALDAALCFGWIDGQKDKFDNEYWLQKFTHRRAKSPWSKINREKAEVLIAQGRMRQPGLDEIERAKADGRWDLAYESQANITEPEDWLAALEQNPTARELYNTLSRVNRYALLYRITTAKKPETRQKRIAQYIDMLNEGKTLYPG